MILDAFKDDKQTALMYMLCYTAYFFWINSFITKPQHYRQIDELNEQLCCGFKKHNVEVRHVISRIHTWLSSLTKDDAYTRIIVRRTVRFEDIQYSVVHKEERLLQYFLLLIEYFN